MPAILTPDTHLCSLCNSIHSQRPVWTLFSRDQTPTPVMACQNREYATSPYGPPPAYENEQPLSYGETEPLPIYSAAIFDELGRRISRVREQMDTADEDLTFQSRSAALVDALEERIVRLREQLDATDENLALQSRENLDPWTACTTAFVRSLREERERLEPSMRERLARGTTSTGRTLPPQLWSIDEFLHRARLMPTLRQQTRSTPREETSRRPREDQPSPPRSRKDLKTPARPQIELPSSVRKGPIPREQTKSRPQQRQKHHHHGRASDVEDGINLICDGVSLLTKKVAKASG